MAMIVKEALIAAPQELIWAAVRDIGQIHVKLCPGFVVDTEMDGADRIVTFGNGLKVRERIVNLDDDARRISWNVVSERLTHHHAVLQVFPTEKQGWSRVTWIAELLPHEVAPAVEAMIEEGMAAMTRKLEMDAAAVAI